MIETAFLTVFVFTFGIQVGGILRDRQYRRLIGRKVAEQVASPWYGPAMMVARLHADQESTGDLPPALNIWAPPKRMPFWVEMAYDFERWRAPRIRRAGCSD